METDWTNPRTTSIRSWLIEYEVYANDVYDHSTSQRFTRTIVYGTQNQANTFAVIAVDTAGNKSDAATVIANLNCSF